MPIYEYKAFAAGGATTTGIVDADTERDARAKLRKDNLLVTKLTETRGGKKVKHAKSKGKGKGKAGVTGGLMAARAASQGPGAREPCVTSAHGASLSRQWRFGGHRTYHTVIKMA